MNTSYVPYFRTSRYRVKTMVELSEIKKGERMCDLGAGDGRIVVEFAKAGAETCGYELDEELVKRSRDEIEKNKLLNAKIYQKDFWKEDLSLYDVITVYPMPDVMERLEAKLLKELKKGAKVLVNYYTFENWGYEKTRDNIYLYRK